ncbi:glycoside hydrolase family 3 protein [Nitratifractor sp.]
MGILWSMFGWAQVSDRQISRLFVLGFRGTHITCDSPIGRDLRAGLGGVILFDRDPLKKGRAKNIQNPDQLRRLTAQLRRCAGRPLLIAVDQEGGAVSRLSPKTGFSLRVPSAAAVARKGERYARRIYDRLGALLQREGIDYDLAPVADLALNPRNRVIVHWGRSYGRDPETVAKFDRIFVEAMHRHGVLTALKHFPGHGSSSGDTHKGFVDVTREWQERELVPYRRLISAGIVDTVMVAHIFNRRLDPRYPASLSPRVVEGLLRKKLGFGGVAITDDLQMGAITKRYTLRQTVRLALNAGNDLLLFGNQLDPRHTVTRRQLVAIVRDLLRHGEISEERIVEANRRIEALLGKLR